MLEGRRALCEGCCRAKSGPQLSARHEAAVGACALTARRAKIGQVMTSSFALQPKDFDRLQKVVGRRLQRKPGLPIVLFTVRVVAWLCIGMAVAAYARVLRAYPELDGLHVMAYLAVGAAVTIVAMPYISRAMMRKHMLAPDGAFLSPQTVQLTEQSLIVQSRTARTEMPWDRFLGLDEDDANYYLFVDAMQAFVLPRSVVAGIAEQFARHTAHLNG